MIEGLFSKIQALLGPKGKAIYELFKDSFRILGAEAAFELLRARVIFSLTFYGLLLLSLSMITFNWHEGLGWFVIIMVLLVGFPYGFFYHVNRRARQTWVAYGFITHPNDAMLSEAEQMAAKQKWTLRGAALAELMMCLRPKGNGSNRGIMASLVEGAADLIEGGFRIVESYLMPALIIDQVPLRQMGEKLKDLQNHLPQTLAGTFGVDIFGGVVSSFIWMFYFVCIATGAGISWLLSHTAGLPGDYMMQVSTDNGQLHLFIFPLWVAIVLVLQLRSLLKIFLSSVQANYFAIFYTRITHPDQIAPEKQAEIDGYLTQGAQQVTGA